MSRKLRGEGAGSSGALWGSNRRLGLPDRACISQPWPDIQQPRSPAGIFPGFKVGSPGWAMAPGRVFSCSWAEAAGGHDPATENWDLGHRRSQAAASPQAPRHGHTPQNLELSVPGGSAGATSSFAHSLGTHLVPHCSPRVNMPYEAAPGRSWLEVPRRDLCGQGAVQLRSGRSGPAGIEIMQGTGAGPVGMSRGTVARAGQTGKWKVWRGSPRE